jgi:hypothetical protein
VNVKTQVHEIDDLIAENVKEFEKDQLRRRTLAGAERERVLSEMLGPRIEIDGGERFVIGDALAGVTTKSIWFENRRVHFAVVVSIAVGEKAAALKEQPQQFWVDLNCTVNRSFRVALKNVLQTDQFLVALSQYMSLKIVPTVEASMREQREAAERAALAEADSVRRQKRMEVLALQQQQLLADLVQIEASPHIFFTI